MDEKNTKGAVSISDVEYVAKLARLEFNDEQKQKLTHDLNDILKYVDKLSQVDTENVDISISAYPMYNKLRDDEVKESMSREEVLSGAPEKDEGYIKVPTIIEE